MGYKLSIVQRQYNMTGWHQSKQFDVPGIQKVKVEGAGKGKSLNAVPSPFARIHLFETAFEMVYHDLVNNTNLAGEAYNRLVSECLDVFELVFNWESHIKEGKNLEITAWNKETEIYNLKSSQNKQHKLLGQTLEIFLQGENAFENFENFLIIKYKGKVIAGTSPFTGFFTTPDDITSLGLLKPLSQIAYFSRTIPFHERKSDIRKFIYDFFEDNQVLRDSRNTEAIRSFIEWQKDNGNVPINTTIDLKDILSGGINFEAFGQNLKTSKSIGTEYFEKQIVRLNYRLNDNCFYLPHISNRERSYDYLLPLTASFFEVHKDVSKIEQLVSFVEKQNSIEVTLHINGKVISKTYQEKPIHETDGKIIDLDKDHQTTFNLGIFPFIKIINRSDDVDFNDFYRVMVTFEDLYYRHSNKALNLKFGKDGIILEDGSVYKIEREERTVIHEQDNTSIGSTFFGLNTCFDFIQVELPVLEKGLPIKSIIIPKWNEKTKGTKQIEFAIDFGTTSTFVAYNDDVNNINLMNFKPLEFDEDLKPVVALLNKPLEKRADINLKERFEGSKKHLIDPKGLRTSIEIQKQEFVPSIIKKIAGNKPEENDLRYTFPIRSAIYQLKSVTANQKKALLNTNISFIYQTKDIATLNFKEQEFKTNLKWSIYADPDTKSTIETFIEELLVLIRTKILLLNGDPRKSMLYWFCPLSFTPATTKSYKYLWNKYTRGLLKPLNENILQLSESETPYYYLLKENSIRDIKSVLTLDIGGGSTDIMLFEDSEPVFGTSVHFGANTIWGKGYIDAQNDKSNGIYLRLKDQVSKNLMKSELFRANDLYCAEGSFAGSDEIINFWLANDDLTKVTEILRQSEFKLSFLLHLTALIYHNLKLIKIKDRTPPTCIIFSGNGSKYVDLLGDTSIISKIWGYFARKIFNDSTSDPQVILPGKNRKEATCYGGLYRRKTNSDYSTENYLGFETKNEKFQKYNEIQINKDLVFKKSLDAFNEYVAWLIEMNETMDLNFTRELGITIKSTPLKKFLTKDTQPNLQKGYRLRFSQVAPEDPITDSLFFYPFIQLLYDINTTPMEDINNMVEKTTYYFNGPDGEGEFLVSNAQTQVKGDSLYTITIENDTPNTGILNVLDNPTLQKRALMAYQGFIDPVCSYEIFPQADQKINTISSGKVRREGDKWIITEKINIEFV